VCHSLEENTKVLMPLQIIVGQIHCGDDVVHLDQVPDFYHVADSIIAQV
jgi:hypothetical protein